MRKIKHKIVDDIELKWCNKCQQWKPLNEFHKNKKTWDALYCICKNCVKEYSEQQYIKHKGKKLITSKLYYINNKTKVLKKNSEWEKNNKNTPMRRAHRLLESYNYSDKIMGRGKGNLTARWIVENIFTKPCAHCGKEGWDVIGCNRLDDSLPHTMDNVEPCCKECNDKLPRPNRKRNEELRKQEKEFGLCLI